MTQVTSSDPLSNPDHTVEHTSLNTRANDLGDILMGLSGLSDAASSISSFVNGSITLSKLASDLVNLLVPAGTIIGWPATGSIPDGWLALGQTIANADTTYPSLWAVAPSSWRSGNSLVLPDPYRRMLKGLTNETPGTTGGTTSIGPNYLVNYGSSNLPSHTHNAPSAHTHWSDGNDVTHTHGFTDHSHTYGLKPATTLSRRASSGIAVVGYSSGVTGTTIIASSLFSTNATSSDGSVAVGGSNNASTNTIDETRIGLAFSMNPNATLSYDGGLSRLWNYLLIKAH